MELTSMSPTINLRNFIIENDQNNKKKNAHEIFLLDERMFSKRKTKKKNDFISSSQLLGIISSFYGCERKRVRTRPMCVISIR